MSSILPTPEALLADPLYGRLKEQVVESTGLTYYTDKDAALAGRIRRRLSMIDARDCASYLDILRDPLRGPSELDALIAEVTIGETYFFRHQEHFDALRDRVLPGLIAQNHATRRLRIWCAGCADGPEPYSLAILMKRDLARQLLGWEVTILGTDINRPCLARAKEGKFEEWAFRAMPPNLRNSCFRKDGTLWRIADEYKEGIYFQYHNLAEDSFPSLVNNLFSFDLIVCRNVMIYFGHDLMRRTVQKFHDCLVPGAWLLVGPAEPNMTCFSEFQAVNAPGVTLYRKPDQSQPTEAAEAFALAPLRPEPLVHYADTGVNPPAANGAANGSAPPTLADAMRHADQGDWERAAHCCERLLKTDNLNAAIHFYHALVLGQMRRQAEAEKSLRHAIYLDRRFVLAHYYLGLSLQSGGDSQRAARSFENALELLRARNDADIFAEADGITAGELKKLAKMHLEDSPGAGMKQAAMDWDVARSRMRASERALEEALTESPARIDAAYRRRAIRLAEGVGDRQPVSEAVPFLIFRLAQERYALELGEIAEMLPFALCTPVPGSPPQFLGVISLRGELRAVLDLGRMLGLPDREDREPGFVLVLRRPGREIGLRVDGIEELRAIPPEEISVAGHSRYTKGVASGMLILLNAGAVLAEVFSEEESLSR